MCTYSPFISDSTWRVLGTGTDMLSPVLHPYYKLDYIESEWGGQAEYKTDLAAGLANVINWTAHACDITKKAVSILLLVLTICTH